MITDSGDVFSIWEFFTFKKSMFFPNEEWVVETAAFNTEEEFKEFYNKNAKITSWE